ncbi:MAG: hypothetical protein AAFR61_17435 [Bacteroidota bacterium]
MLWIPASLAAQTTINWMGDDQAMIDIQKDAKTGLLYHLGNDENFLYLTVRLADPLWEKQVLLAGLYLWIDPKGKKKERIGIHFPTGLPITDRPTDPFRLVAVLREIYPERSLYHQRQGEVELINWGETAGTIRARQEELTGLPGFEMTVGLDSTKMTFLQARLPLKALFDDPGSFTLSGKKAFSLGLKTGELGRPDIRGTDAVGLSGGGYPGRVTTEEQRRYQRYLDEYREFAVARSWWIKKVRLAGK